MNKDFVWIKSQYGKKAYSFAMTIQKARESHAFRIFLLVLILTVFILSGETALLGEQRITLSPEEQAWLSAHPRVKLGFNPDMRPLLIQGKNGQIAGIMPDIFKQLTAITNLNIEIEVGPWHKTIEKARRGEIDGLLLCVPDLAEVTGLVKTIPYISTIPVVFGKRNAPVTIARIDDLKGKRVAQLKAVKFIENILAPMANEITTIEADTFLAAVSMVLEGKADVILGMNFDTYLLSQSVLTGIVPLFIESDYVIKAGTAIRSDLPELVSILNKGLDTLGEARINQIVTSWTQLETPRELTVAELDWLAQHPVVRLGIDPSWAPVEYFDSEGRLAGITADNIRILTEKLGTRFEPVRDLSWAEVLRQTRNGRIDVISAIAKSEERAKYLLFTDPYLKLPMVIVTREDAPVIEGIEDLRGKTIAVMEDYITHFYLKRDHPEQQLLLFKTINDALKAVATGRADAVIENAAAINLARNELGLTRLTVAATTPYAYELSIGVRKDWPELIPILEKALDSITEREKQIIKEKWVNVRFQKQTDWRMITRFGLVIVVIAGGLVLIFFVSNRRLAAEIRQRKKAEEEVKTVNRELTFTKFAFDNAPDGIEWLYSESSDMAYVNKYAGELLGYSQEEMRQLCVFDFDPVYNREAWPAFRERLRKHGHLTFESIWRRKDGFEFPVEISARSLTYEGEEFFLAFIRDISEKKQIQDELRQAKEAAELANKSKSEFIANISHELRNPMHQILSYLKYGTEKIDKPREKLLHYFSQSRKSAERLMTLLNDLLDLSKMESGKMDYNLEVNNVLKITKEAVSEMLPAIEEKNLSLRVIDPTISTQVTCDYFKIGQVMRNLLTNAIKFTHENKNIEIWFQENHLMNQNRSIPGIQVSVVDQGVGIPGGELVSIFEKFSQCDQNNSNTGGTGLGLAICKEIINAHHGKIWAENNPDGGATFSFILPLE